MKIKNKLGIVILTPSLLVGSSNLGASPVNTEQSPSTQNSQSSQSLEERVIGEVHSKTGAEQKNLRAKSGVQYGTETFPLGSGYLGGSYLTVKNTLNNDLFIFSQRGQYLGVASPLHQKMETRWGKGNAWESVEAGSNSKRVFVWYQHSTETVYTDTPIDGGKIEREFSSSLPVYRVINNHLVKDKSYNGIFGGDSQHYIDDRGNGLFFVVTKESLDSKGRTLSEEGEFFKVVPGDHYEEFALVQRKAGSNVLEPSCTNCEISGDNSKVYQTIVPKQMQSTSYQSNPVKNKAHQKRRH